MRKRDDYRVAVKSVTLLITIAVCLLIVGLVFPRSGLGGMYGVTLRNSVGVIDSGFRGEVCAPLVNLSCDTVFLPKGSRVCQMAVVPFVPCDLVEVDKLSDTERGEDGFGSTGIE